ncbi:hypothetical protein D3C76_960360 [compost metagenome]
MEHAVAAVGTRRHAYAQRVHIGRADVGYGNIKWVEAHLRGTVAIHLHQLRVFQRRCRELAAAWPFERVAARLQLAVDVARHAGDTSDALEAVVERLEVGIGNAPVLHLLQALELARTVTLQRGRAHAEVPLGEAPSHASPVEACATDRLAHLKSLQFAGRHGGLAGLIAECQGVVTRL